MDLVFKKIIAYLENPEKNVQIQGLNLVKKECNYVFLPHVVKLTVSMYREVFGLAREVSLALAEKCLFDKESKRSRRYTPTAAAVIRQHNPVFIDEKFASLKVSDSKAIIEALVILKHFVSERKAKEILLQFISHPDNKVRATVVLHIGMLASKNGVEILTKFMRDNDNRVKANAIEVFERLSQKNFIPILNRFRRDKNNRIRANVLKALFTIGNENIYQDLSAMMTHENPLMRTSAVWVIGEIGGSAMQYLSLLELVLDDDYALLQDNLVIVMKKLGDLRELNFLKNKVTELMKNTIKEKITKTPGIKLEKINKDRYMLVKISGTIAATTILSIKLQMESFLKDNNEMVLDLAKVAYIDSSGLGFLMNLSKKVRQTGGYVFICNCSRVIKELFEISKIDRAINLFASEAEIRDFLGL